MPFGIQANVMQMSVQRAPVPSLGSPGRPLPELLVLTYLGKSTESPDWCKGGETADTSRGGCANSTR